VDDGKHDIQKEICRQLKQSSGFALRNSLSAYFFFEYFRRWGGEDGKRNFVYN